MNQSEDHPITRVRYLTRGLTVFSGKFMGLKKMRKQAVWRGNQ